MQCNAVFGHSFGQSAQRVNISIHNTCMKWCNCCNLLPLDSDYAVHYQSWPGWLCSCTEDHSRQRQQHGEDDITLQFIENCFRFLVYNIVSVDWDITGSIMNGLITQNVVLVNSQNKKFLCWILFMSFMNSKCLVNCFVWCHQEFEEFAKDKIYGGPPEFYHRLMYIAPSGDRSVLTLNLPFTVTRWRFEVVSWCLEWECCTFWKTDENSFKSTNTIMALNAPED